MDYITLNDKKIPIEYTNRVRRPKIYNQWDEFYIKCPRDIILNKNQLNEQYKEWMNKSLENNYNHIKILKSKINKENPALLERSKEKFKKIVLEYLDEYKYKGEPNNVYIRKDMDRSWATHSINHNITFNYDLSKLPLYLIEYVTFHELCHFQEFEHTTKFYKLIEEQYSNYNQLDMDLNMYNYLILHNKRRKLNLE